MLSIYPKKRTSILACAIILSLQLNEAVSAAAALVPDKTNGRNPGVSQAANGVPVVDIRRPNGKGLSHNQYLNMQVGKEGLIFNNTSQISKTQLAGYINGNKNLAGKIAASAILNEVTGKLPTSLKGYMEIAGQRADLIIANPNGIVGNNFGYINTGRAVLTTGKPVMGPEGDLRGLSVSQGTIAIEGLGLDARTTDGLEIYARAAQINAGIWSPEIKAVTGSNQIDYGTGKITKVTSTEDKGVSLDVAALGGMYAGKITLLGTAKGLGVNMAGNLQSINEQVTITQNGDVINSGTISGQRINIASEGNVDNAGTIAGQGKLEIDSSKAISNTGTIHGESIEVTAADGNVGNTGTVYGQKSASINSSKAINNTGIFSGGNLEILAQDGNIENGGEISAKGSITVTGSKAITNTGKLLGNAVYVTAQDGNVDNTGTIYGESIEVTAADGNMSNAGTVYGQKNTGINSSKAITNAGTINGNAVDVTAQDGNIDNTGTIHGETGTNITGSKDLTNTGLVNGGDTIIAVNGAVHNAGRIYGDEMNIKANILNNLSGAAAPVIAARQNMTVEAGVINNKEHALMTAEQDMNLKAGNINNHSATIEAGSNITIAANALNNVNNHFATDLRVVKIEDIQEVQGKKSSIRLNLKDYTYDFSKKYKKRQNPPYQIFYEKHSSGSYAISTPSGWFLDWYRYEYRRTTKEDVITSTDPGKITAAGNITLSGGTVTNDKSQIIAGGSLTAHVTALHNTEVKGKRYVEDSGTTHYYHEKDVGSGSSHSMTTKHKTKPYGPPTVISDITVSASAFNGNGQVSSSTKVPKSQVSVPETITDQKPEVLMGTVPDVMTDSRFFVNAPVTAGYYVETDPDYTNKKQWLSSDYFFNSMGFDVDKVAKRLGDGYYEQKLIRDQVMNLTGKRFAGTFTSDTEQYKKLLANAVEFAKKNNATIGVQPTPWQLENLKEPIVWMEEQSVVLPDGQIVKALVPRVYLPVKETDGFLSSAVIGAENIDINVTNGLLNKGTIIAGKENKLSANNINNYGGTIKGSEVIAKAMEDVNNIGGTFEAEKNIEIAAGRDVNMETTTSYAKNSEGSRTSLNQIAGVYVTGDQGQLNVQAGHDVKLKGVDIAVTGKDSKTSLADENNINLETVKIGSSNDIVFNKNNYRHDRTGSDVGTSLKIGGSLTMEAGQDVNAQGAYINTGKDLSVRAGKDINIKAGESTTAVTEHHKDTVSGTFSSKTTTTHFTSEEQRAVGSTFSGDTVELDAGRDVNVIGSNVVGTKDVTIGAGQDVNIKAADEETASTDMRKETKSGIMGSGFGITIGKAMTKLERDNANKLKAPSTVGSITGSVDITAGKNAKVEASDIVAGKDINITGESVDITSADEQYNSRYKYEHKVSGLTISIGGGIVGRAQKVLSAIERAREVKDNRLSALYGVKAAVDAKDVVKKQVERPIGISGSSPDGRTAEQKAADEENAQNKAFDINVGWGCSSSKDVSHSTSIVAKGSNVQAGGAVNITAKQKDLNIHGSNVAGEDVKLEAAQDINITAAENSNKTDTAKKSSQIGFGIAISTTGDVGGYVSAGAAKENIKENSTTYTPGTVTAADQLTIKSGDDTNIIGSKVSGAKVKADVEGNLNIESIQEKHAYKEKSSNVGLSISGIGLGKPDISGNASKGKMKSDHKSVTDQAGILAGEQGFDITVKGNTDLKGAVIDSKGTPAKNKLTTGTISFEDVENKAEYETSGMGLSLGGAATNSETAKLGDKGLIPNIPISSSDKAAGKTKSAVAPGTITITDKQKQKQDISDLNRDTADTLNKLDQIFDKDTIQERQELAALFGELAFNQLHEIGERKGWKDGNPNKVALHAIVGGIMAKLGNSNFLAGATGAAVNEMLQTELSKIKDPALHQWASAAVGAAVGGLVGNRTGAQSGASTAATGTKENRLNTTQTEEHLKRVQESQTGVEAKNELNKALRIDEDQEKQLEESMKDTAFKERLHVALLENPDLEVFEGMVIKGFRISSGTLEGFIAAKDGIEAYSKNYVQRGESKVGKFVVKSAQIIGGTSEIVTGMGIIKGSAGLATLPGWALITDGTSSVFDGVGEVMNMFDGGDKKWNFVENTATTISPEYGQEIYDGSQIIVGIWSVSNNIKILRGYGVANKTARNITILKAQNAPVLLNDKNEKILLQPILINNQLNKKYLTIDTICNALNVSLKSNEIYTRKEERK